MTTPALATTSTTFSTFRLRSKSRRRYGMARLGRPSRAIVAPAPESDYGSDIDTDTEIQIAPLLAGTVADSGTPLILESIEQDAGNENVHPVAHVPKPWSQKSEAELERELNEYIEGREQRRQRPVVVEYDEPSRRAWSVAQDDHPLRSASLDPAGEAVPDNDKRSPLERFRTKPKKPLSVTDLVSPAWCELQYWFTLTKHGRKRRTPAMKQGSAVHKKLEEEVHRIVKVQITTKEDMWGLKIWNVIQGLRTLRITGMTREMEIWGVVDGQVVNGIIDELSYRAPYGAVEGEETTEAIPEDGVDSNASSSKVLLGGDPSQRLTINDFFKTQGALVLGSDPAAPSPWLGLDVLPQRQVYITDVKTRNARTLPQGAALRPTKMQLFLYHHILTSLASNAIDANSLFARYAVDPALPFTDAFIAQVGGLEFNFRDGSVDSEDPPFESEDDSVAELLAHNSLTQLWSLMIDEYARAIPSASVSPLVKAEFRRGWDGSMMGSKVFRVDTAELDTYVAKEMSWWKGEREAVGVDVNEAYKCGLCEFADECGWRKGKVEEVVEKARLRKRGRARKSEV